MIANVAGFICHMFTVIAYLFSFVINSVQDPITNASFFLYLIFNVAGLVLTTANGIAINEMVSFACTSTVSLNKCRADPFFQTTKSLGCQP
jgi:hypothetical protein